MRIRGSLLLVATLGTTAVATPAARPPQPAPAPHAAPPAGSPACPIAARVEIAVPADIDEVRAVVDASTPGAAAAVTLVDAGSDRELSMFGRGVWGLQLQRPLPAGRVVVAVEPVLDAPASACVDQVELLRRGAVVARVVPR